MNIAQSIEMTQSRDKTVEISSTSGQIRDEQSKVDGVTKTTPREHCYRQGDATKVASMWVTGEVRYWARPRIFD